MKETKLLINKIKISLKVIILSELDPKDRVPLLKASTLFFQKVEKTIENKGIRYALAHYKEVRLGYTRWLSGRQLKPSDLSSRIGLTRSGLPKDLGSLLPIVEGLPSPSIMRVIMTLLCWGRTIELKPELKPLNSITAPSNPGHINVPEFQEWVKSYMVGKRRPNPIEPFTSYTPMYGQGPNGPSLRTSCWEATQLDSHLIEQFSTIAPGLTERVKALKASLPNLGENWNKRFNLSKGTTFRYGKISRIPDKEGKTRVIAVTNFWTQQALKPLHDSCEGVLKSLP